MYEVTRTFFILLFLSSCATVESVDPLFKKQDMKCRQDLILYCEGRYQADLKCACIRKNQIEFINF